MRRTNYVEVLVLAVISSIYTMLRQRRLRWFGHVHKMDDGKIPKDFLYGELTKGGTDRGRPLLRYRDVCKRDLKPLIFVCNLRRRLPLIGIFGSILYNISFLKGNANGRLKSLKSAHRERKRRKQASIHNSLPRSSPTILVETVRPSKKKMHSFDCPFL